MSDRTIPQESTYDVVTFKLLSDGTDITNQYDSISLSVTREVNRIPMARVVLRDGDASEEGFAASDGPDLIPGKELEIAVGFDSNDRSIFKGIIVKHALKVGANGDSVLRLTCQDVATQMTVGRHNRYFVEGTDSEAIEEIIGSYSDLSADVEATAATHAEIVQFYATDWDFVLSRAEMNGQIVLLEDGTAKVKAPATSGDPLITLTYGANLLEFEAEMDARSQLGAVKATAWSYTDGALLEAEGAEPSVNAQGNLSGSDLAAVAAPETLELRHSGFVDQPELQAWADAQLLKSRLAKIQGRVTTRGYPDAKPDALVQLEGMGGRFNGLAYVSGVRHELNGGTWITHLQLGCSPQWFYREPHLLAQPAAGLLPGVNGLQIGVVVQLQDDPNGEDRVLVKIPTLDNEAEGIWARVATLDAGANRGSFFRPEIGDEVVLGFLNDDPRDPIVLGMLNSSAKPAPVQASDDNHEKGIFTRSEMKLTFNDDTQVITIETPSGNKITISDEDKGITLEDQNGNTIVTGDSGITMSSPKDICFEASGAIALKASQDLTLEGLNVSAKANAQFKAEGSGGAEVSTSAIAVLKGSLVQIN
ncbi:type VI secretion system tip protein VgrG [Synechococcus sp. PCC 7336]|uniref:type VI secretion system tip protein VgrG n=1 Tax=Synechococcus sp. PCC 7336 TaxID=195250 RepID=UPI00034AFD53|nr:type VI secretion system tip protein VgrG [Synechococcus sp. PCC 7336]